MSSGSPSQIVHDVGGPIRGSPSSRQTGTPEQLSLKIVERRIERSLRGLLAGDLREPLTDLLEGERDRRRAALRAPR